MSDLPERKRHLPHENVYVRIHPSEIHGVGVIAIVPIAGGTDIFQGDDAGDVMWVDDRQLSDIQDAHRELYKDFAIRKNEQFGCPESFNELTAAWYLNHSWSPNVACDPEYRFSALCDIQEGEELTVNYETFSDEKVPEDWR